MSQMAPGLIIAALLFLLPGLLIAVGAAMFMRRVRRFRAWIRISLILTVLGSGMWMLASQIQSINLGSVQMGSMVAVVALVSAILAGAAVWLVPRKIAMPLPPPPKTAKTFAAAPATPSGEPE